MFGYTVSLNSASKQPQVQNNSLHQSRKITFLILKELPDLFCMCVCFYTGIQSTYSKSCLICFVCVCVFTQEFSLHTQRAAWFVLYVCVFLHRNSVFISKELRDLFSVRFYKQKFNLSFICKRELFSQTIFKIEKENLMLQSLGYSCQGHVPSPTIHKIKTWLTRSGGYNNTIPLLHSFPTPPPWKRSRSLWKKRRDLQGSMDKKKKGPSIKEIWTCPHEQT